MMHGFSRCLLAVAALLLLPLSGAQAGPCKVPVKNYPDSANHSDALMRCVLEGKDPPRVLLQRGGKRSGASATPTVSRTTATCPPNGKCRASVESKGDNGDPDLVPTGIALPLPGSGGDDGGGDGGDGGGTPPPGGKPPGGGGNCTLGIETEIKPGASSIDMPCGGEVTIASVPGGAALKLSPGVQVAVTPTPPATASFARFPGTGACADKVLIVKRDVLHLVFDAGTRAEFQTAPDGNGMVVLGKANQLSIMPLGSRVEVDFGSVVDLPEGGTLQLPGATPDAVALPPGTRFTAGNSVTLPDGTSIPAPQSGTHGSVPFAAVLTGAVRLPADASLKLGASHATLPRSAADIALNCPGV